MICIWIGISLVGSSLESLPLPTTIGADMLLEQQLAYDNNNNSFSSDTSYDCFYNESIDVTVSGSF